jgi:peptidoglycan/LPS O-acetylase OafA/YrhL
MSTQLGAEAPAPREFFGALESLRGIAAFLVVLYHLPPWTDAIYWVPPIRHGYLMVDFFFVLSGFVLYHSYGNRLASATDLRRFVALRLGRLYPTHLLFILPFFFIELAKYAAFVHNGTTGSGPPPSLASIGTTLVANLLLLQGLGLNSNVPAFNFPNWSISVEFYAYLVFGFSVLLLPRRGFVVFSIGLVAFCLALLLGTSVGATEFHNMLRCLVGFFAGCCVRMAFEFIKRRRLHLDWPLLAALIALIPLCAGWQKSVPAPWWEYLTVPAAAALVITLPLTPSSIVNRIMLSRPLRWLGAISYSLYMCHALVQWIARQACRVLLHQTEVVIDGISTSRLSTGQAWIAYPAVIAATLLLAHVAHVYVEEPLRALTRRRITGANAAAPS